MGIINSKLLLGQTITFYHERMEFCYQIKTFYGTQCTPIRTIFNRTICFKLLVPLAYKAEICAHWCAACTVKLSCQICTLLHISNNSFLIEIFCSNWCFHIGFSQCKHGEI